MKEYIDISKIKDWEKLEIIGDDGEAYGVYDISELPRANVIEKEKIKRYKVRQIVETEYLNTESTDEKSPQMYINFALSRKLSEILLNEIVFTLNPSFITGYTEITGEIAIITKRGVKNEWVYY